MGLRFPEACFRPCCSRALTCRRKGVLDPLGASEPFSPQALPMSFSLDCLLAFKDIFGSRALRVASKAVLKPVLTKKLLIISDHFKPSPRTGVIPGAVSRVTGHIKDLVCVLPVSHCLVWISLVGSMSSIFWKPPDISGSSTFHISRPPWPPRQVELK